jgi:hypothetical protein
MVWLILVVAGLSSLWSYETKPGFSASAPQVWPKESLIQPDPDQATLVMLAHPNCPCTRATIGELAAVMAHSQGRLKAFVLFLQPEGYTDDWAKTDVWQSAAGIPGVVVMQDLNGEEAERFHASTSGQTLLYDLKGQLIFSGGITAGRGHSGDNAGRSAIVSLVNKEVPDQTITSVFGCPLFDSNHECRTAKHETNKP